MPAQSLPLVSIVTPVHNEEKCLSQCIESVLGQTYSNWDYTIVDNCSTDGTLAIARGYASRDSRIRIVSNDTLVPAIANFNIALRQISSASKYCKMVLADDWMFPECLERMVGVMEEHLTVGIVGAYGLDGRAVLWAGLPYCSNVVSGREICRQRLLGAPYVFGSQTSVLYRSDLVRRNDPFYNESNEHPDSEACFKLLKDCDFGFVHQVLTFSPERPGAMLSKSRERNAMAGSLLHELVVYGPYYLAPEEHSHRLRVVVAKYYEFLARSFFQRRDRSFWDYHQRQFNDHGIAFTRARLALSLGMLIPNAIIRRTQALRGQRYWGL